MEKVQISDFTMLSEFLEFKYVDAAIGGETTKEYDEIVRDDNHGDDAMIVFVRDSDTEKIHKLLLLDFDCKIVHKGSPEEVYEYTYILSNNRDLAKAHVEGYKGRCISPYLGKKQFEYQNTHCMLSARNISRIWDKYPMIED